VSPRRRLAAVPEQPRRVALYVRVSALMGRSGDAFHSPGMQVEAMQRLVHARGMVVVGEPVQDIDRSGRDFSREGVQQVMAMARAGQVDAVALYDLSRLGRNTGESLRYIAELRELGVSILSTTEQIDDSPEGQFMLGQFLGMAQLYSDQVSRRWQQLIARRAEQGRWHGSNPPFGYRLGPDGLEPDPVSAPLMREAFERYAAGHLISKIARHVGDRRGAPMAINQLKNGLRNPVYAGRVRVHEQTFPGRHTPLVDDVLWQRVQRRLELDAVTPSRRLAVSHSLVSLVVCDVCDYHLHLHVEPARPSRGMLEPVPRLQCRRRIIGGPNTCRGPGVPQVAQVEQAVLELLQAHIACLRQDAGERAAKLARRARASTDVGRLQRELTRTEAALGRLTVDRARREISEAAYQLGAGELERAVEALRTQIRDAEQIEQSPPPQETVKAAEALLRLWPVMETDEKNRALKALIRQVRVRPSSRYRQPLAERVHVEWLS
jgi:site-specific DNA recombinase